MKKILLCLFFMCGWVYPAFSQDNVALPTKDLNNPVVTPETGAKSTTFTENIPVSHWSLGIKGGINYFRIAASTLNRTEQFHFTVGGMLEYTINPLVGLGVEYMNNPFGCRTQTDIIAGGTNDATLFGSINLSNLLLPNRSGKSKFNIYGEGGVGFAFYNFSLNHAVTQTDQSAMATLGLNVEYALSKSLSLGLEGQYRYYNWRLEKVNTVYNTEALTTTIGLRYKFGATGKKPHARNFNLSAYTPTPAPVIIEKAGKDNTTETMNRLKAIEDENAALNDKINKLNDQILVLTTNNQGEVTPSSYQNVEFEFGSDKLTGNSYSTLDQIAVMLKNNPASVKLSVVGYTDYIGTEEYNQILSIKRANAVKLYLTARHIPATSVIITGYGERNPIAPNETREGRKKNRRVEFQITK